MRVVVALCLAGCDVVWHVDRFPDPPTGVRYIAPGDYDHDGLPNDADPCPLDPLPRGSIDSDGDGVGDDCDPDLVASGDCIVLLDNFLGGVDPRWIGNSNTGDPWSVCGDGGTDSWCSPRSSSTSWLYFADTVAASLVVAKVLPWSISDSARSTIEVSTGLADQQLDVGGSFCALAGMPSAADVEIDSIADGIVTQHEVAATQVPYVGDAALVLRWTAVSGACEVDGTPGMTSVTYADVSRDGFVGFRNQHVDVNLQVLLAYGSTCR